jgi:hypothetical protein
MLTPLEASFILRSTHELKQFNGQMIPGTHYPMFPGGQFSGSIAEIRALIKKQKRANGVRYTTVAGSRVTVQIPVSATAQILLGVRVMRNDDQDIGTLQINNEVVISNVSLNFLNPLTSRFPQEYFALPRPLSGKDQILFTVQSTNAAVGFVDIFFL